LLSVMALAAGESTIAAIASIDKIIFLMM